MPKFDAIILAAGRSTRMKSALPKVLQPVCGRPLVAYTVAAAQGAEASGVMLVIGDGMRTQFEENVMPPSPHLNFAVQKQALGTADAVKSARGAVDKKSEYVLIIPGDVPLIRSATLKGLIDETLKTSAVLGVLTVEMAEPGSYGRIIRDGKGLVTGIKEAKDATPSELKIKEINSSIYFARADWLFETIEKIVPKNAQKEFYLTDIVGIASGNKGAVVAVKCGDEIECMGVNTRKELSLANRKMREKILEKLMADGVGIVDENCTYIDDGVTVGADTTIWPCSFILGKTRIGRSCVIENGVVIKDSVIGDGVVIRSHSVIEGAGVANNAVVGPFARLRPGAVLEEETKIGNFVEVKKSTIKKGAKASHLSYIGDATVGERTNIGCGMITCNYDGKEKHRTVIGKDVLIGSDVQMVAPVKIGDNAVIGAGSTITEDVPENSLAIARSRQIVKRNWKKS
jgi:bifunctional UDP-N-acetylglucosamine pyrophosphorylase/glucosamine-1-phosphate N-acetyltransferase